ncbi:MAG: HAMP domain-containing sensor histidine kinase [Stackebrandtia sp.]
MSRRLRPTLRLRLALWIIGAAVVAGGTGALIAPMTDPALIAVTLTAAVAVCGAAGYFAAGRALRPLHEVTATARRLSTKTMDERIRLDGPSDELRELADTVDAMLDRISESFEAQRRFVANASHELRTPLAVMRTEIDVALSNPQEDPAELRNMGEVVRDGCARVNDLIESLLWLARAEAEGSQQLTRAVDTDLGDCAAGAVETASRLADELGLSLATAMSPAPVVGDPSLLERVAGNLIENAIRHNVPEGRVWVIAGAEDDRSWLVVGNTGSDVDAATVEQMFEPFNRGDEARVGRRGAGLGMSIVKAVCEAHSGTVRARALPDGGLETRVEIPTRRV